MNIQESKIGVIAFGVKTGIITFDDNIIDVVVNTFKKNPELLQNKDILCVGEAVTAITQHNTVYLNDVKVEIKKILKLKDNSTVGVLFPILSRNRFSMILKAISKCVPKGKVIVQLSFPTDEQGNPILAKDYTKKNNIKYEALLTEKDIPKSKRYLHPETGIDYIQAYKDIAMKHCPKVEIYLSNMVEHMLSKKPDAIIVANVHAREEIIERVKKKFKNTITLQDIYSNPKQKVYSEYGLLGSNILDPEREILKLAPHSANKLALEIQAKVKKELKKDIEVIIKGDGGYKDPESGIYELADPVSAFGVTPGIKNKNRIGVKTKYLMQKLYTEGKKKEEILKLIEQEKQKFLKDKKKDNFNAQGTTPRKIENLVSALADLVSGSADANTPIVVVRGFI